MRYWSTFSRLQRYGERSLVQLLPCTAAVHARADAAERADRAILERALRTILDTFEQRDAELGA